MTASTPLNLARMTTTTTGTGTITLGSAVGGFLDFATAGATNGMTLSYTIVDLGVTPNAHEVGVGVYTATGTTLTRTLTKSSTGSLLSLSGNAEVFVTLRAEDLPTGQSAPIVNTYTSSQTGVIGDANNIVCMNVGSSNTYTIPPNSSVAFPVGTQITVIQLGSGGTSVVAGAGVTINVDTYGFSGRYAPQRYSSCVLRQVATDVWEVAGWNPNGDAAFGWSANGVSNGAALGSFSNGSNAGAALGYNAASAQAGVAVGYSSSGASYGAAIGYNATANSVRRFATTAGSDGATSQAYIQTLRRQTTDATPTVLTTDAGAASTANQDILTNNSGQRFTCDVIGVKTDGSAACAFLFTGAIRRGANAASTALVGTPAKTVVGQDSALTTTDVSVTADTTNGGLAVTVTGVAATTLNWTCTIHSAHRG